MRITSRRNSTESQFKVGWPNAAVIGLLLQPQLVKQNLIEDQLANLAIDFPDAIVERRNFVFVFPENGVGRLSHVGTEMVSVARWQILATMFFKEATQNVVQQLAGVNRLQIERGFAARFELQDTICKKAKRAIAIRAESARAVDMLEAEVSRQHHPQISLINLAIVGTEPVLVTLMLDFHATPS